MVRVCDSSTQEVEAESVPATCQGPSQPGLHEASRETERGRKRREDEKDPDCWPDLYLLPSYIHTSQLSVAPTWAKVPSRMVALGSEVEAASSSHSGVQMFPGEMLEKGEKEEELMLTLAWHPQLPQPV